VNTRLGETESRLKSDGATIVTGRVTDIHQHSTGRRKTVCDLRVLVPPSGELLFPNNECRAHEDYTVGQAVKVAYWENLGVGVGLKRSPYLFRNIDSSMQWGFPAFLIGGILCVGLSWRAWQLVPA